MDRGRRREGEQSIYTHGTSTSVGRKLCKEDGKTELAIFTELQWQTIYTTLSI
jgi:hypothetical protein